MRFIFWCGIVLALLPNHLLHAQTLRGTVLHDSLGTPVPFASVGVRNKPFGTATDAQGRFAFADSPELSPLDTVVISCVGYRPVRLPILLLRQRPALVQLWPQAQTLREVTVRHRQLRPEVLGRTGTGGVAHWGVNSIVKDSIRRREMLGSEFGTFLTSPRNCYVDNFNVYVQANPFRQVRLRLLFYAVRDDRPAEQLLPVDIQLVLAEQQRGWITVDLRPYNLQFSEGQKVIAALQWLDAVGQTPGYQFFDVPALLPSPLHRVYTRNKSQANWKSYPARPSVYLNVQSWK